jgi:hypothetical protein
MSKNAFVPWEIVVAGQVGAALAPRFASHVVSEDVDSTRVVTAGVDQATLLGLLARIETLELELLAVRRADGDGDGARAR